MADGGGGPQPWVRRWGCSVELPPVSLASAAAAFSSACFKTGTGFKTDTAQLQAAASAAAWSASTVRAAWAAPASL